MIKSSSWRAQNPGLRLIFPIAPIVELPTSLRSSLSDLSNDRSLTTEDGVDTRGRADLRRDSVPPSERL